MINESLRSTDRIHSSGLKKIDYCIRHIVVWTRLLIFPSIMADSDSSVKCDTTIKIMMLSINLCLGLIQLISMWKKCMTLNSKVKRLRYLNYFNIFEITELLESIQRSCMHDVFTTKNTEGHTHMCLTFIFKVNHQGQVTDSVFSDILDIANVRRYTKIKYVAYIQPELR